MALPTTPVKIVLSGLACVLLASHSALAQSVAVSPNGDDLDGDGRNDRVELHDADKSVEITLASGVKKTFVHGFAKGTVAIGGATGSKLVAVSGLNDDGELAAAS